MLGEVNPDTYNSASLIELLHTATLVHDDVVDDANERRGFFSINALWKNKIAVLVGDFLLSKVLLMSIENKKYRSLEIVADRKSTRLNSSHVRISYAVFCLKKKKNKIMKTNLYKIN